MKVNGDFSVEGESRKWADLVLVVCAAILWPGCGDTGTEPTLSGAYNYTSYDSRGVAIVGGWFTMNLSDTGAVSGEWHFRGIGTPQNIGPQTGDGSLIGRKDKERIWIELNPQFRDNIQLEGRIDEERYSGTWAWISFAGITNQGTFEATRK
jgi:hypothetical protein